MFFFSRKNVEQANMLSLSKTLKHNKSYLYQFFSYSVPI